MGVNATVVREGKNIPTPRLLKVTKMRVKETVGKGAQEGCGLKKFMQKAIIVVSVIMKQDRYGLGYKQNAKARSKMMRMRRERRITSLEGAIIEGEHMMFPHLHETFYSAGVEHDNIRPS